MDAAGGRIMKPDREWVEEAVEWGRQGNLHALNALCLMLETEFKKKIGAKLKRKGVSWQDLDDARQDVTVQVCQKITAVRNPEKFHAWLNRVVASCAKKYRPQYVPPATQQAGEVARPKQIGTKWITIDDQPQEVKVYEPFSSASELPPRQPLLQLLDESSENWVKENQPNHPRSIDFRNALAKLPPRWCQTSELIFVDGYSRTETAAIMGVSKNRIFNLIKNSRRRLPLLLPGYVLIRKKKPKSLCADSNAVTKPKEITSVQTSELADAWWPLVLASLRRHAEASYFARDDGQFLFGETADLGGNAPENHGSDFLNSL
jgi:RNA polymerase sigma factor (sigma-70 family)